MTSFLLFVGVVAGTVLGIVADWLLKPILPENPRLQHSIAGIVAVFVLTIAVVSISRFENNEDQTSETILVSIDALATIQSKSNEELQSIVATIDSSNINDSNQDEAIQPTLTAMAREYAQLIATNEALENLSSTPSPTAALNTPTPTIAPTPANQATEEYLTGLRYENGYSVEQDFEEAVYWFRRAANKGFIDAMEKLAQMYEDGIGVSKDLEEAERWKANALANNAKRFTIPCEICGNNDEESYYIYLLEHPANPDNPLEEEEQRLWEDYGITMPQEIVESFSKIYAIAEENDVSFIELVVYALEQTDDS